MIAPNASQENAKNIRVLEKEILEQIDKQYESRTKGVNRLLLFAVKQQELLHEEIRGVFRKEELFAMLDNENGTMIDSRYWGRKRMFLFSLEDGVALDGLDTKWGVDFYVIKDKVESLSNAAFLYLHEQLYLFWNEAPAYGSPSPSLDSFWKKFKPNE